jgi:hypothetical protein
MVHPDCPYLIRTLPSMVSDERDPEDVDTDGEDHAVDALRYFVMGRPSPGSLSSKPSVLPGTIGWLKKQMENTPVGILSRRSA